MDRYGADVLSTDWRAPRRGRAQETEAVTGLVVEDVDTGWCGAVVRVEKAGGMQVVHLEDRRGRTKGFPLGPGFLLDGKPVVLTAPTAERRAQLAAAKQAASRTASGSVRVTGQAARVASGSRIWVEGRHDAELVEKVWGDDLRVEGVVVEMLDGVDDVADLIRQFAPTAERRLGVLVDHLVAGSKESRVVAQVTSPHVLVTGHPYVDVWQAVKPASVGIAAWPVVPKGRPWKEGVCAALGWGEPWEGWRRVLAAVDSYADLEVPLLRSVEMLIDFVADPTD